jgi:Metallo-beta-lactamase superfamily
VPNSPPEAHQLEISVFGPGMGECIVAHLGDGDWIVVDSCLDRNSREPVALDYLKSLQVDVSSAVKLVVATHWHDDHIKGLARVLQASKGAKFVDSIVFDKRLLARLVKLGSMTGANASATDEYNAIFEILLARQQRGENVNAVGPMRAIANKPLLSLMSDGRALKAEVIALSPSDGTFNRGQNELSEAILVTRERRRPASRQGPNQLCVALWLKVGEARAILGADLEHASGVTEGWNAIVGSGERPQGRAEIFKVPHHGSPNAHSPECWTDLLCEPPLAVVTPYSPSGLPGSGDLVRLCKQTDQVFLTSDHTRYKVPRLNHTVERTLRENKTKRRALEGNMGHVRIRLDAREPHHLPLVELFNGAEQKCL